LGGELFDGSKQFCFKPYETSLLLKFDVDKFLVIGMRLLLSWMMRTLQPSIYIL